MRNPSYSKAAHIQSKWPLYEVYLIKITVLIKAVIKKYRQQINYNNSNNYKQKTPIAMTTRTKQNKQTTTEEQDTDVQ